MLSQSFIFTFSTCLQLVECILYSVTSDTLTENMTLVLRVTVLSVVYISDIQKYIPYMCRLSELNYDIINRHYYSFIQSRIYNTNESFQ